MSDAVPPPSPHQGEKRSGGHEPREDQRATDGEPGPARNLRWYLLFWLVLIVLLMLGRQWFFEPAVSQEISYSEFKSEVESGNVSEVIVRGRKIVGVWRGPAAARQAEGVEARFSTRMPAFDDPGLIDLLEDNGVVVKAEADENWLSPLIIGFLPLLLILGLLFYSSRMMQQQMGDMGSRLTGFGKSRAKRFEKGKSEVTFEDVAGLESAKIELREIVEFLKEPGRFQKIGAKVPHGVLMMGPPGTGKTLMARAVAGEAGVPFFSISGSEFVELFVGVGASRVRDMFETAKKEGPAILFIDEIDAVGRARGTGLGGGHDEREQTLNQILSEMDGFSGTEAVVAIAATNRPDVLDPALLRPGRFDRKITLELPPKKARRQILDVHVRKVPLAGDVDLDQVAASTVGFSGADLANLVNEAALIAARHRHDEVSGDDFEAARDRIILGSEREDLSTEEEKRLVAYHESGHALIALLHPHTDPLRRVTIIPRGRALGVTEQQPREDRHNVARSYLEGRIAVMLGGRTAERLVFGETSTGAEDDLKQVTQLAKRMVCQWGMSDKLGPVAFRHGEEHVFLGREMAQPKDFSEHTARLIDEEIQAIVRAIEQRSARLLEDHRDDLDRLAEALLEHESLDAAEIAELVRRAPAETG